MNLRIKPKRRIVRERPEPLAVPGAINQVWSMDFMHDQLSDPGKPQQNTYVERYNRMVRYSWHLPHSPTSGDR